MMDFQGETKTLGVEELMDLYTPVKEQIETRLMDFRHIWETAERRRTLPRAGLLSAHAPVQGQDLLEGCAEAHQEGHDRKRGTWPGARGAGRRQVQQ